MILCLGQGEPSYVPDGLMGQARDSADLSYLAFLQCYARDLAKWEIICFFSSHQDEWCSLEVLADAIGSSLAAASDMVCQLAQARLLEERVLNTGVFYRLTRVPQLRHQVARLGAEWRCQASQIE